MSKKRSGFGTFLLVGAVAVAAAAGVAAYIKREQLKQMADDLAENLRNCEDEDRCDCDCDEAAEPEEEVDIVIKEEELQTPATAEPAEEPETGDDAGKQAE